jgi:hypothetical protein
LGVQDANTDSFKHHRSKVSCFKSSHAEFKSNSRGVKKIMTTVLKVAKNISYVIHSKSAYDENATDQKYNIPLLTVFEDINVCLKFAQMICLIRHTNTFDFCITGFKSKLKCFKFDSSGLIVVINSLINLPKDYLIHYLTKQRISKLDSDIQCRRYRIRRKFSVG